MKKAIIIGGGISGLTAGIFAQKSGFQSVIFEKHSILGGECTGWDRGEYHIDGCIHWLTGTKEGDKLNELWKQVGALGTVDIYKPDKFITVEHEDKQISIYRDLNKLREHFLELAPEDKDEIERLITDIRSLKDFGLPSDKPFDHMNLLDFIKLGRTMKNAGRIQKQLSKINGEEYCNRFKSPLIRKVLGACIPSYYDASALLFTLATFTNGNGDYPIGGSRAMAQRMVEKYLSLGGRVQTNSEVEEILIEQGKAAGVQLKDGSKELGEYIIPACDVHIVYNKLLKGRYVDRKFAERYADPVTYPLSSCVYLTFAVDADMKDYPEKLVFDTAPFGYGEKTLHEVLIHHYCFDSFAPKDKSVLICTIFTDEEDYDFWKDLKKNPIGYKEEKVKLANTIIHRIEERFPELKDKVSTLDVATPVTYERYCGAYKGAWMSFMTTPKSKQLIHDGKIKGVENLYMTGQWLMPPGGLPIALVTGKWAIQRICKKEKRQF